MLRQGSSDSVAPCVERRLAQKPQVGAQEKVNAWAVTVQAFVQPHGRRYPCAPAEGTDSARVLTMAASGTPERFRRLPQLFRALRARSGASKGGLSLGEIIAPDV